MIYPMLVKRYRVIFELCKRFKAKLGKAIRLTNKKKKTKSGYKLKKDNNILSINKDR